MFSDYHVHSKFSFDSEESPRAIVQKAISLNMKQICFTDHQDFNWPDKSESPYVDFPVYFSALSNLKEEFSSKIKVLTGIELGITEDNYLLCKNLVGTYSFDYVIGSCHIVDNMDPYYSKFWQVKNDRDCFELYFKTLLNALRQFNDFDALGHLDYIVRYSPNKNANYNPYDYMDYIDEVLKIIIAKDIKLEINTSNYSKGLDFPNPHNQIIKRYKELGGLYVTMGSDAHKADYVGYGFGQAKDLVEEYGLKVYTK